MTDIMIKDALRYIGTPFKEADDELIQKVKDTFKRLQDIAQPKSTYQRLHISIEEGSILFQDTSLKIESNDLVKLCKNAASCYVLAVTLGQAVDQEISIKQRIDMLGAVILDACASVLIDKVCDDLEEHLMAELKEGEFFTMRFSPGYGDVPLAVQEELVEVLGTRKKIGLSLTKTNMLLPTKSITALIGISNQRENRQKSCGTCTLVKTCAYRKRGDRCGL